MTEKNRTNNFFLPHPPSTLCRPPTTFAELQTFVTWHFLLPALSTIILVNISTGYILSLDSRCPQEIYKKSTRYPQEIDTILTTKSVKSITISNGNRRSISSRRAKKCSRYLQNVFLKMCAGQCASDHCHLHSLALGGQICRSAFLHWMLTMHMHVWLDTFGIRKILVSKYLGIDTSHLSKVENI